MLKKLRTKFIALNMITVAVVLTAVFATICVVNYQQSVAVVEATLNDVVNQASDHQGKQQPGKDGQQAKTASPMEARPRRARVLRPIRPPQAGKAASLPPRRKRLTAARLRPPLPLTRRARILLPQPAPAQVRLLPASPMMRTGSVGPPSAGATRAAGRLFPWRCLR